MKKYIVQVRFEHDGRLCKVGEFKAHTCLDALVQAARTLAREGSDAVELIATERAQ